jgi:hypothetical protein
MIMVLGACTNESGIDRIGSSMKMKNLSIGKKTTMQNYVMSD